MVETYDIGSLPFEGEWGRFLNGVRDVDPLMELLYASKYEEERCYFEEKVIDCFVSKLMAGVDIPNFPQFRDMNQMFLQVLTGSEKTPQGYVATDRISFRPGKLEIPEVAVLRCHAKDLAMKVGKPLRLKVCVTGPYTLALTFAQRSPGIFGQIANPLSKIVDANIFCGKYGGVEILSVDEPSFGLLDDPLLDFGQEGRESLLHGWESVFSTAKTHGVRTVFHLHSTTNESFWEVRSVDIIESHVSDPLYVSAKTRERLSTTDKFLRASVAITDFDTLIRQSLKSKVRSDEAALNQKVGEIWNAIRKGTLNPHRFLETAQTMKARLRRISSMFGKERIAYAGPECGLRSFPTVKSALELLGRASNVAHCF